MKFLTVLLVAILSGCSSQTVWFKGNTHTHTEICGHADSHPDVVAKWYLDEGYNFVILSEHNFFIDPKTVKLPEDRRKDFILVPGQEVTGRRNLHSTAMNVKQLIPWKYDNNKLWKIIQNHVDETTKGGGYTILNHPDWQN